VGNEHELVGNKVV